jgi:hypothetical protein
MRTSTIFFWIAGFLSAAVLALFVYYVVKRWGSKGDLDAVAQTGLLLATALGALWTVWLTAQNNETAWLAYRESIRPSALFRAVQGPHENGQPVMIIVYGNYSSRDVEKMRTIAQISSESGAVDISDLFPKDSLLPAGDERRRKLEPYKHPLERGFDLKAKAAAGEKIKLILGYSHEHAGERITVPIQQSYIWNPALEMFEIED